MSLFFTHEDHHLQDISSHYHHYHHFQEIVPQILQKPVPPWLHGGAPDQPSMQLALLAPPSARTVQRWIEEWPVG
jgi:hypothetical protein